MGKHRFWLTALTLIGAFLGGVGLPALAASYVVNTLNDNATGGDSLCTLREAIESANNAGNGDCGANSSADDTITFSVSGTITLSSPLPTIVSGQGALTINGGGNITVSGNNSVRVLEVASGAQLTLQNITIAQGKALQGGGIWNDGGTVTVTHSTLSGNSADFGGGIANLNGTVTITNSTISGNSVILGSFGGGGIANLTGGVGTTSTVNIKNSIVGNNTAPVFITFRGDCANSSIFNATGVNFDTDGGCPGFTQVTSAQLNLGPLANNGGPTQTHALLSGSVAIDAAPDCTLVDGTTPVTQDQRGVARPQGAACDVGAYEAVVVTLTIAGAGTGSGTVTGTGISCTISIGSTSGDCSESALPGANPTVTLSATADSGSTFAGWSGHADCADGVVTINGNKVCVAQFTVVPQRTLTVAGAGTGSGTVAATGISCTITVGSTSGDCAESYAHGTSVTLTATPNSGSTFTGWSGCDSVSGMDCQVTLTAAKVVTAQFTDPSLGCPNVLVEARPTTARFIPNLRRAYTRSFSVTVRNNSGGPVTVSDITLRPGTFDGTYTLVRISPTLPQTVLHGRSRTFTVAVRKAANTPAQTVTAPYFDVQMGCGVLPAGARLVPLRVEGLRAQIQAGQMRLEASGEGIASVGVELFDLSGRRLLTQQGEGRELTVAVDGLANGVYLYVVRVRGFDGREYASAVRKIVILR
jgi:CSLREA domain-containing protein